MKLPLVPIAALLLGGVSALAVAALPAAGLHLPMIDAGATPRGAALPTLLFAVSAAAIGAFTARWRVRRSRVAAAPCDLDMLPTPVIRRADAHPDARPRPPLRASYDLDMPAWAQPKAPVEQEGATAERDLPVDLDQPLAAFDPTAIPAVPLPPPVPPRRERAASAGQRTPAGRDPSDRLVRPETDASVHALLERLERGVVRRNQASQVRGRVRADRGLDDALAALRSLARQA
ncbi:hypothetical protein CA233_02650 [Sphingomonas sp. ABOLD]|uniref:Uncharacterized protein n=1 Tax=Sphingomonas trueperi TaxID=53317 RepID=A0A7X5XWR7_9SPHN|nr:MULTISPECIES: hypothetical protein [Sphingomonas]NJB96776.1 hypothetical protein [Sphingomonas trueperi]RSV44350.1 hypothetical protein CA234_02715 [Sphingomonas sp. ABOLE]RSV51942.1 hypothetical protein CA233_02650 [Sphingomonas sp. ABOLD]